VDADDNLTEGSRSNLFVVAGGQVITPPTEKVRRALRVSWYGNCRRRGLRVIRAIMRGPPVPPWRRCS